MKICKILISAMHSGLFWSYMVPCASWTRFLQICPVVFLYLMVGIQILNETKTFLFLPFILAIWHKMIVMNRIEVLMLDLKFSKNTQPVYQRYSLLYIRQECLTEIFCTEIEFSEHYKSPVFYQLLNWGTPETLQQQIIIKGSASNIFFAWKNSGWIKKI